jgi:hypothetical protein
MVENQGRGAELESYYFVSPRDKSPSANIAPNQGNGVMVVCELLRDWSSAHKAALLSQRHANALLALPVTEILYALSHSMGNFPLIKLAMANTEVQGCQPYKNRR